jgi:hypothetical protein
MDHGGAGIKVAFVVFAVPPVFFQPSIFNQANVRSTIQRFGNTTVKACPKPQNRVK